MGCLTNYAENEVLDHVLKVGSFTRPATLYLALCKSDPGEAATGAGLDEPSGGAYARQSINVWDSAASRATANTSDIPFPTATGDWGTITHWAICDALTDGNVLAYGVLSASKNVETNGTISVLAGDLDISINSGGMSNYLANAILDHLFEGTAYTPATNLYIAVLTAAASDSDTGSTITEPGDTYARQNENTWDAAAAGLSQNSSLVAFPAATTSWDTLTHHAICDALTNGNLLLYHALDDSRVIGTGDIAEYAAGALKVTLD